MRIIIDVGHPGHVHLFRPFAREMQNKGHKILFTCRQKEFETELLKAAGFSYKSFGKHFRSKNGKIWGLVKFNIQMLFTAIKFNPSVFISHGSIYAAQVAWLLDKKHISLEDSGNMEQIRLYRPFTKVILTPDVLPEELGKKQIRYKGYHELAYLHTSNFSPQLNIKQELDLALEDEYCILRFVSWQATHDVGHQGFSAEQKSELIAFILDKGYKVLITSEAKLPIEMQQYQIILHPAQLHYALAAAKIVISEGATIASEAGVLGVPTIYVNSIVRSYNEDQQRFGTVFNYRSGEGVIDKLSELLEDKEINKKTKQGRLEILKEKIDVTAFLVWFVENYPESFTIMKENPGYQERFK